MNYPAEAMNIFETPQQAAFDFLLTGDHQNVIYGAIKRLHIYRSYAEYDDLVQEGRLAFVRSYLKAPATAHDDEHKLLVFIYQGVYWHLLNCLDQYRRKAEHQAETTTLPIQATDLEPTMETNQLYQQLLSVLSFNEQRYLTAAYIEGLNVTEMARQFEVSRKTIYWWKAGVAQKAKIIWQKG
ncbi:sigma-70 family RNA polymerase sigma factor [Lentilactobacillus senioris]|uniref:sigma-70 family RNA polymerase sigma factor n=1 Tax=Lentilactobacillus senioris TaxID=931534 RepID=UPI0022826F37|nr:sigma-70 family RNA polymerase sigma factor [Lentilactobacillus senioris]MCY9806339.1 sigma-70 family RNA polymerase sigma factor [Lentilactobacillus senioris]